MRLKDRPRVAVTSTWTSETDFPGTVTEGELKYPSSSPSKYTVPEMSENTSSLAGLCMRMEKPAFLFDGRNLLDHAALYEIGFISAAPAESLADSTLNSLIETLSRAA